jgi:hypothetical protein
MQPLTLRPLPSIQPPEDCAQNTAITNDFVDEAVVRALMAGPVFAPSAPRAMDAETAKGNALDFAGWNLAAPEFECDPTAEEIPSPSASTESTKNPSSTSHISTRSRPLAACAAAAAVVLLATLFSCLQSGLAPVKEHTPASLKASSSTAPEHSEVVTSSQRAELPGLADVHLRQPVGGD